MLKKISILSSAVLLAACSTTGTMQPDQEKARAVFDVTDRTLQHSWELVAIDGTAVALPNRFKAPQVIIGENLAVRGHAGCNSIFGQGELNKADKQAQLRVAEMGSTRKLCPKEVMGVESAVLKGLADWNTVEITRGALTLSNSINTLSFKMADKK